MDEWKMNFIEIGLLFGAGVVVGYLFCLMGTFEHFKTGEMFYRRKNGSWYPYDPKSKS